MDERLFVHQLCKVRKVPPRPRLTGTYHVVNGGIWAEVKLKAKTKMDSINLKTGDLYNMIHEAVEDALMKQSARSASTLLTRDATAKRLGVDVSTLWRWDKSGYLKPVRIGRSVHYRLSDIEARERGEIINQ